MPAEKQHLSAWQPTGDGTRMALWQLSGPLVRQEDDSVRDDVPSAPAVPVWFFATDGGSPDSSYQAAGAASRSSRVYHVVAFPADQRSQIEALATGQAGETGIPKHAAGDRVFARFNNQSGRWEIVGPAEDLWRFQLKTPLTPGPDRNVPSAATAYLVVYDSAGQSYLRTNVEFQVADFLGVWNADPGCRGYARRMADSCSSVGWEIVAMETEFAPCTRAASSSSSSA
jgi:hypothetical protein